jgi:hypothetical protein
VLPAWACSNQAPRVLGPASTRTLAERRLKRVVGHSPALRAASKQKRKDVRRRLASPGDSVLAFDNYLDTQGRGRSRNGLWSENLKLIALLCQRATNSVEPDRLEHSAVVEACSGGSVTDLHSAPQLERHALRRLASSTCDPPGSNEGLRPRRRRGPLVAAPERRQNRECSQHCYETLLKPHRRYRIAFVRHGLKAWGRLGHNTRSTFYR